jgi:hypothetical protein
VFTDFQSNNELGISVADEYLTAAKNRGYVFVPIILDCSLEENLRRLVSIERPATSPNKLTETEIIREMRAHSVLHQAESFAHMEIDVTTKEATVVADEIACHVRKFIGGEHKQ